MCTFRYLSLIYHVYYLVKTFFTFSFKRIVNLYKWFSFWLNITSMHLEINVMYKQYCYYRLWLKEIYIHVHPKHKRYVCMHYGFYSKHKLELMLAVNTLIRFYYGSQSASQRSYVHHYSPLYSTRDCLLPSMS